MAGIMENIKLLRNDLRAKGWHITGFPFKYKNVNYIVLFEDLDNIESNKYYLVRITFIKCIDPSVRFSLKANSTRFDVDAKEFRMFFGIKYSENFGNIFQQFYKLFNTYVPDTKPDSFSKQTQTEMIKQLNYRDKDSENSVYCFSVKRNGLLNNKQMHRTKYNADKTKLLRPDLFKYFESDDTISFCYTDDPNKEKKVILILLLILPNNHFPSICIIFSVVSFNCDFETPIRKAGKRRVFQIYSSV